MPSWNIHTAHAERILADRRADAVIADGNAFLFGNYAPDIYVGFMVPDASFHIDYCLTHLAAVARIPLPEPDFFWDRYIAKRRPCTSAGVSLALGAWAHLVADRYYNGSFRAFCKVNDVPDGDELRLCKQADFDLFGRTLDVSSQVSANPELLKAAQAFVPYHIPPEDVMRSIDVATAITRRAGQPPIDRASFQLLSAEWMGEVLDACSEWALTWLDAWRQLEAEAAPCMSADIRAHVALPDLPAD